jgi:hypothetical protein
MNLVQGGIKIGGEVLGIALKLWLDRIDKN